MTKKIPRDALTGRFVTVETNKKPGKGGVGRTYIGKIGSYGVRSVDGARFDRATRAANSALKDSAKR